MEKYLKKSSLGRKAWRIVNFDVNCVVSNRNKFLSPFFRRKKCFGSVTKMISTTIKRVLKKNIVVSQGLRDVKYK
jgi:hypothetical protein